jgi:hypothetical protein
MRRFEAYAIAIGFIYGHYFHKINIIYLMIILQPKIQRCRNPVQ